MGADILVKLLLVQPLLAINYKKLTRQITQKSKSSLLRDSSPLKVDTHINYVMGVKTWQKYSVKNE